ncbi:unnamed protein product [Heligmosomoides polygyrus]|uniref:HNH endonuclease n=1 Tax=Heligmosomoides polygyrus TaxID=6339 RepID=A0A183GM55_HELPZ|nr:unnamed protein product [Heligmosomoides polygyrus]
MRARSNSKTCNNSVMSKNTETVFKEEHDQLRNEDKENEKKLSKMQQQIVKLTMEVARLTEQLQRNEAERSSDPLEVIAQDDDHWQRMVDEVADDDSMEQIPALVSDDEQDPGDVSLQPTEGSEPDLAEAEDVVRDEQQEDIENSGLGPEVRVQQDEAEEADPGPEVRVQQVNIEQMDPGPEVRVGQRCKGRHKRCFDCQRIEGTAFEDLIPNDEGHHWALGNVLHKKLRIQELEDDGRRLTLEDNGRRLTGLRQFFSEQRDQQGRRTTSTRAGVTTSRLL